jgi:hypothetical protein
MGTLDIGQNGNIPTAQSQNTFLVTRKTQEQTERICRENYDLLDEMEP